MPGKTGNSQFGAVGARRSHDPPHVPPIPQWRIAVLY